MSVFKSLIKFSTAVLFFSLMSSLSAQEIKLQGQIFQKYNLIDDVQIQLYSGDTLLQTKKSNGKGKFKIKLESNKNYRLVFSKANYLSKTIVVLAVKEDTKIPTFKFDMELEKEREFRYVDTSELDDPVAMLFFNKKKGELDWDRNHTFKIHQEIAELKDLNDEKRRARYSKF